MATLIAARRYTLEEIERLREAFEVVDYIVIRESKQWQGDHVSGKFIYKYNVVADNLPEHLTEDRVRTAMMAGVTADEAEARLRKIREDFAAENKADHPELIEAWAAQWLD